MPGTSVIQHECNSHLCWSFCVDFVNVGAQAVDILRGNVECGSAACCGCRCRPAVGHETAALWNWVCSHLKEPSTDRLYLSLPQMTRHPSCQPIDVRKTCSLPRVEWGGQLPQQNPFFQTPSASVFTKEKAWAWSRGETSVTEGMGRGWKQMNRAGE